MKNTRIYIYMGLFFLAINFIACSNSDDINEQEDLYIEATEGTEEDVKKPRETNP